MTFLWEANSEPIPGYRLIEPLGSGGVREVWKCEGTGGLFKAIQSVYGSLNSLVEDGARAEQEFKALQQIKEARHPFVCSVFHLYSLPRELLTFTTRPSRDLRCAHPESKAIGRDSITAYDMRLSTPGTTRALNHTIERASLHPENDKP